MTIFSAVITLGLTLIQKPERRATVFVQLLLVDLAIALLRQLF
jgi:hypothetical protein